MDCRLSAGGYFSPYENPRLADGPEGEHLTDRLTDESIRFLEEVGDRPFFLYLSFYAVHTPLQGKPELVRTYEQKLNDMGLDPDEMLTADREWIRSAPPKGTFIERIRQGHPTYAAMIETLDVNVGRILSRLEELGLDQNTVVFFMSDNGGLATAEGSPTSNLPLRAGKGWLYEGGIREPMLVRWPGSKSAGRTVDVPVISTDFYPTILELAEAGPLPEQHRDGVSLVPLLKGSGQEKARPLFWHYPHYSNQGGKPGAAVRLDNLKLIEFFEDGTVEMYDLATDPGESTDLSSQMPENAKELQQLLHRWQKEVGAEGMDPNPGYDPNYRRTE